MFSNILHVLIYPTVALTLVSCSPQTQTSPAAKETVQDTVSAKVAPRPIGKPIPPLQLAVPTAPPEKLGDTDFKAMDADELFMLARSAANQKSYRVAAIAQYWSLQKSGRGQYDLACYLARTGQIEPAFYWLQVAGLEEGVDTAHSQRDEDLTSLRDDPRWEKVLQYLQHCNQYFETAPIARTVLILPKGYQKPTPVAAILWLHGYGSRPEDFVNEGAQQYADQLNVAIIGASATLARGPRKFIWSDDIQANAKRMRDALAEVSGRVTIPKGRVITLGFSQGAQTGLEVVVRYPEEYAGSIALSPGVKAYLDDVKMSPLLAHRGFVLCCNGGEHPAIVRLTAFDAEWLGFANAKIIHKVYPDVATHSFPEDFEERFPEWVKFVEKASGE